MKVSRILIFLITSIVSSLAHTQTLRTKYEVGVLGVTVVIPLCGISATDKG